MSKGSKALASDMKALISAVSKLTANSLATKQAKKKNAPSRRSSKSSPQGQAGPRAVPRMGQSGSFSGSLQVSAPSSIGTVLSNSYFRMDGKAQVLTELSGMGDSTRVVGSDVFATQVASTTSGNTGFTASYTANLSPTGISPRLATLASLYQYYAIREVQVQYMPMCASSTNGAVGLGVAQDSAWSSTLTIANLPQVMELTPSVLTPVWQAAAMTYRHNGTKLWLTSTATGETTEEEIQCQIAAVLSGAPVSTFFGNLRLTYVIDFYKPTPALSSVSAVKQKADAKNSCVVGSKDAKDNKEDCKALVPYDDMKSLSGAEVVDLLKGSANGSKIHSDRFVFVKKPNLTSSGASAAGV